MVSESNCTDGALRLAGKPFNTQSFWKLEVCFNRAWGSICNDQWDDDDAVVACRELGFQTFYGKLNP